MGVLIDADESVYRPSGRAYFRISIYRINITDGDGLYRKMFDACHGYRHGWSRSKCNINLRICVGVLGDDDLMYDVIMIFYIIIAII